MLKIVISLFSVNDRALSRLFEKSSADEKINFHNTYLKLILFPRSYLTKKLFVFKALKYVLKFEHFNTHALTFSNGGYSSARFAIARYLLLDIKNYL